MTGENVEKKEKDFPTYIQDTPSLQITINNTALIFNIH